MYRTEVNLLNCICKTDFFSRLQGSLENLSDYSMIFNEYCEFLQKERHQRNQNHPGDVKISSPNDLFSQFELNRITQTIQISNVLIEEYSSKQTYQLVKDLDNELSLQPYFLRADTYSFLDVIVFSSLQKCRIWPKLCKEGKKSKKELPQLIDWYRIFMKMHKREIEYQFDPKIVTSKYQRKLEQFKKERKTDLDLMTALRRKDRDAVIELLKNGSDVESIEVGMYMRAAHIACAAGDLEMCRVINEFGCDWESLDKEQQTPLFYAVTSGSLEVVRFLVEEQQVDYTHKEYQDRTPFYLACFLGNMPIITYLYDKGVNINEPSKLKRCALSKACYLGHLSVVQFLVSCPEINLTLEDSKGRTAMHNAAWGIEGGKDGKRRGTIMLPDSPESIEILHQHGHPIDYQDLEGNSPLISAASSDARASLRVLLQRSANKNLRNYYGESPLFLAAKFGHIEVLKILVEEFDADWQMRDIRNTSPTEIAGVQQNYECLDYLLELELKHKQVEPECFIKKIHDDYISQSDQLKIFNHYDQKVGFSDHITDLSSVLTLLTSSSNQLLVEKLNQCILSRLNSEQIKQYFYSLCENDKFSVAFDILASFIDLNPKNQRTIIFEPEDLFKLIVKDIDDQNASKLLREINCNWIDYIDECTKNSFIHILCEQRKVKSIVDIISLIKNKANQTQLISTNVKNFFLQENQKIFNSDFVRSFFNSINKQGLNCLDICLLLKAHDVHHVIETFLMSFLHEKPFSHYIIPKYYLEIIKPQDSYEVGMIFRWIFYYSLVWDGFMLTIE